MPSTDVDPHLHLPASDDETGVPGLRTWPRVYAFAAGAFVLWLALLTTLMLVFGS
jgi:hypothetical protein